MQDLTTRVIRIQKRAAMPLIALVILADLAVLASPGARAQLQRMAISATTLVGAEDGGGTGGSLEGGAGGGSGGSTGGTEGTDGTNATTGAPVITHTVAGTVGNDGWFTSDVTISWSWDDQSATASGCDPVSITADQLETSYTCEVTNSAGTSSDTVTVKRDATPPSLSVDVREPDHNGWYNEPFSVSWIGTDAFSGVASCDAAAYSGPDTTGDTLNGGCADIAGNAAQSPLNFRYDNTDPTITLTTPADGASYVLNADVAADYACDDATAGIPSGGCAGDVADGALIDTASVGGHSFSVSAADDAGNTAGPVTHAYSVKYAVGTDCLGAPSHQILQPIKASGANEFQKNRTVPAKFRVCDADGNSIGHAGVVQSFRIVGTITGGAETATDQPVPSTNGKEYRFSGEGGQWIHNIDTKPLQANTTYLFSIGLDDDSAIDFRFTLRPPARS